MSEHEHPIGIDDGDTFRPWPMKGWYYEPLLEWIYSLVEDIRSELWGLGHPEELERYHVLMDLDELTPEQKNEMAAIEAKLDADLNSWVPDPDEVGMSKRIYDAWLDKGMLRADPDADYYWLYFDVPRLQAIPLVLEAGRKPEPAAGHS